jgi:hypothetical protein
MAIAKSYVLLIATKLDPPRPPPCTPCGSGVAPRICRKGATSLQNFGWPIHCQCISLLAMAFWGRDRVRKLGMVSICPSNFLFVRP